MIVELEEIKSKLLSLKNDVYDLEEAFNLPAGREEIKALQAQTSAPDFWDDPENSQKILQKIKQLELKEEKYKNLVGSFEDIQTLIAMAEEEDDSSLLDEIKSEFSAFTSQLENLTLETLLTGEYDHNNAIISFHAGAGGTEAQDWALILYRMYGRWADAHNFKIKVLDYIGGEEAGMKSADILVEGENAFGYLKSEMGVHRLIRVSPFDTSGRRHTSFAAIEVMPEITEDVDIEIKDEDLKVDTYRSGGAGGQHVNKTESAIRITHIPTGVVVECQDERSQHKNREKAMKVLRTKLYEAKRRESEEKMAADRRSQVGSGDRSERIRTYNYPQGRVTDHRIGLTLHRLDAVMDGDLDEIISALTAADQAEKLQRQDG